MIVRDFQKVIGEETKHQLYKFENKPPDYLVACVGGGSNAIGLFYPFINSKQVKMFGVEAAGKGIPTGEHAATLLLGEVGIFHGMRTYLLQDENGYVQPPYSISAGLDYPGVGPEHSYLKDSGRVNYSSVTDDQAITAAFLLSKLEGIIPALESAHAFAYLDDLMPETSSDENVVINLSGRGDKDMSTYIRFLER
jgi:tryptophan synthase beta chain